MEVSVRHNDVEQAMRRLKKMLNREGVFKEVRQREVYEKPCIKRARLKRESVRRARKAEWKRRSEM